MGLLILTHSSRRVDHRRSNLNFFNVRYRDPDRLARVPAFESLAPARAYRGRFGALSVHTVGTGAGAPRVERTAFFLHPDRIQHALLMDERRLLLCLEAGLELHYLARPIRELRGDISAQAELVHTYDDPWFGGLHTVSRMDGGRVVVSASAADAIMVLNLDSGEVEARHRMPAELYGHNYALDDDQDLRAHYVANDYQTTHINAASVSDDGRVVVSALIQGAVGEFDLADGSYRELCRGFLGCHGARLASDGSYYFADSVNGNVVFLDTSGRVLRRYGVNSRWLHDVQELTPTLFALSFSDRNALWVLDVDSGKVVHRDEFSGRFTHHGFKYQRRLFKRLGCSTQFLSWHGDL